MYVLYNTNDKGIELELEGTTTETRFFIRPHLQCLNKKLPLNAFSAILKLDCLVKNPRWIRI